MNKKQQVKQYLNKHSIQDNLTEAVQQMCKHQQEDAWGFLSTYFAKLSKDNVTPKVTKLIGRQVLDSRGNPTVEVDVYGTQYNVEKLFGRSSAPSGASTGKNEALELRDKDEKSYLGKGTLKAVANVNDTLSKATKDCELTNLKDFDDRLCKADGTKLKTNVGGNAITASSFAFAEASAKIQEKELYQLFHQVFNSEEKNNGKGYTLPRPMVNILNGGKHAGGDLQIQEFMIIPKEGISFKLGLKMVTTVYHHLKKVLIAKYGKSAKNVGDEGGFTPNLANPDDAMDAIAEAVKSAGYVLGEDIFLALDCAASEFYVEEKKAYEIQPEKFLTSDEMVQFYLDLKEKYPALISIEDGLEEADYEGWIKLTAAFAEKYPKVMIVGDDLYTTNTDFITKGLENKWANALLLKVNQIGTISEAMSAARMLFAKGQNVIVSHRSGETVSSLIADLAVGIGAQFIKTGATARGERISKYNRLLQIEEELAKN